MEQKMVIIPFDLETAKKINIGGIVGRIVTEKGRNRAEIVYEDNSSNCPLLVVIHSISVSADWFSATGKALSSENRLLLEVPEYITFKDGEVLSNEDGSFIFILNIHGEYLTSFYASLAVGAGLNISGNFAACNNEIERYRLATDSEKQMMICALKASNNPKAKEYLKRFFGIEEKPKYDFKPFDKVLVRDEDDKEWHISLFAREIVDDSDGLSYKYECSNGTLWDCCIPFEGNEHLLGTTENPEKWIEEQEEKKAIETRVEELSIENKEMEKRIEEDTPKVIFAMAVTESKRSCLVAELAKIICQNGMEVGQNRLFKWLRKKGYLGTKGEYYNQPMQRSIESGLFEIKKRVITKPNGNTITVSTPMVTPAGQLHILNKFLECYSKM